jgi:cell division protease FtsH
MKKKNQKICLILVALVAVAACVYFFIPENSSKSNQTDYSEFYDQVSKGEVASAEIKENKITYKKTGDDKTVFVTQNPSSPSLHEYLLMNGVEVKVEKNASEIFDMIFNVFFYIFIIFIIFIAYRKVFAPASFKIVHKTGVKFDDVVGMDRLKKDMSQIVDIMKNPAAYAKKGIRMPKGVLMEGEPGNGKTLFAKAMAGEAKVNFIATKATDFESMFMSIGPMKVKTLFRKARRHAPCIVFIDEFDGIGTKRNYSGSGIETENTRIVTALLNELDGFEPASGVLVLAATNSIHALDEALIRPGRFDLKFSVPYPSTAEREKLVQKYSKSHTAECSAQLLAKMFDGYSCAKIESVLNKAALIASQDNRTEFSLEDVKRAEKEV